MKLTTELTHCSRKPGWVKPRMCGSKYYLDGRDIIMQSNRGGQGGDLAAINYYYFTRKRIFYFSATEIYFGCRVADPIYWAGKPVAPNH